MKFVYLTLLICSTLISAQDQCGFPKSSQDSGFEAGEQSQFASLPLDSTPLTMTVAYPTQNLVVGTPSIQVYGALTGPANLGVRINDSVLAINSATDFTTQLFTLQPGTNALAIKVQTQTGGIQTITRNVTYDPALGADVQFRGVTSGDYAPITIPFSLKTRNPAGQTSVVRTEFDFDGNGSFEIDAAAAPAALEARYATPGVFLAKARITFDDGNPVTPLVVREASYRIQTKSLAYVRLTLCGVFYGLKNKLIASQIPDALTAISPRIRASYEELFSFQGPALATRSAKLGVIVGGQISDVSAELQAATPNPNVPGEFLSSPILFARDASGVWRISGL